MIRGEVYQCQELQERLTNQLGRERQEGEKREQIYN